MASLIWALFMLLLPLISAEGSFTVPATYNHKFVPDVRTAWARALRRWSSEPRGVTKIAAQKGQFGNVTAKTSQQDLEYLSLVGFGTPPQYLPMDLDTGSVDVWVCSTNTALATVNRTVYDPDKSTTAILIANVTWEIEYGDGSVASGIVYNDTINVGGVEIGQTIVESATQVSDEVIQDTAMSGVFGLAYHLQSQTTPPQDSVFSALEPLLNSSLFTVDLKFHDDGEYEFGYINSSKYIGDIYYVPLLDGATYWSLNFTMYTISGSSDHRRVWIAHDQEAIVDTGTSLLLLPSPIVAAYYAKVKGAFNSDYGWSFPCESKLPSFQFAFGHTDDSKFTIPGEYINYSQVPGNGNTCLGGIQDNAGIPFSILGDIFLKAVFAVFDYGHARVGFAAKPGKTALAATHPA